MLLDPRSVGMDGFASKPVKVKDLVEVIRRSDFASAGRGEVRPRESASLSS